MGKFTSVLVVALMSNLPTLALANEAPALCIERAKQAANATYQGCLTEQKTLEIDEIRDRYHQKLEELRGEYERELRQFRPVTPAEPRQNNERDQAPRREPERSESLLSSTAAISK